jgi:DNA repair protein RecO (recombination protein O)
VLRTQPLGESDRIVVLLARGAGKVRAVAKGARRSRKRFGANLMLLSRVRVSCFEKEGQDLARLESADLLESFYLLQEDPERGAALACLAEVADAFAREEQEDDAFFRLLHAVLRAVRDGLDLDWAARYFEIWTLRLHGFLPSLETCGECGAALADRGGRFLRREGVAACARCGARRAGDPALPPEALAAAAAILKRPPSALVGTPASPAALAPLRALSEAIFFDLFDRRFKSYDVWDQLRRGA